MIVCLLNDYEMRTIGTNPKDYEPACEKWGIEYF